MEQIANRRNRIAQKELKALKRTVEEFENKEIKLIDEKLDGKVEKDIYERMQKQYREKRRTAEARLSQLEVDYDDPLDFLDKCIIVASTLQFLHKNFKYEHKKQLLKAVFERIYVSERAIIDVKLNPPFSILLGDHLNKLFEDRPSERTKEDIFEQIVIFTISEQYMTSRNLVETLIKKAWIR